MDVSHIGFGFSLLWTNRDAQWALSSGLIGFHLTSSDGTQNADQLRTVNPESIASFEDFYELFESRIFGYLWRMCGDKNSALDLTQETFLRAWQQFAHLRDYRRPDSWLFRVASRLAMNHARQLSRRARAIAKMQADRLSAPDDSVSDPTDRDAVLQTLQMLPSRDRAALVLHSVYGFSCEELASALRISEGAARFLLWRGRERFRRAYAQVGGEL